MTTQTLFPTCMLETLYCMVTLRHCSCDAQNLRSFLPDLLGFGFYRPEQPNVLSLPHAFHPLLILLEYSFAFL